LKCLTKLETLAVYHLKDRLGTQAWKEAAVQLASSLTSLKLAGIWPSRLIAGLPTILPQLTSLQSLKIVVRCWCKGHEASEMDSVS
jgi:hypothetical protein